MAPVTALMIASRLTFLPGHTCVVNGSSLCSLVEAGLIFNTLQIVVMAAIALLQTDSPRPELKLSDSKSPNISIPRDTLFHDGE